MPSFWVTLYYDLFSISFTLVSLFFWLKTWFHKDQALIGVLFVASTMPIAFQYHNFQPWSLLEPGLFTVALIAIHGRHYLLLTLLMVLASLNRETSFLIPLALLSTIDIKTLLNARNKTEWQTILVFSGLVLIWAVIFGGLRYFLGSASHVDTIEGLLLRNTTKGNLFRTFINGSLFLGGFWIFVILGFKYAPRFFKRVILIVPFYLLAIAIWALWFEVRLLMPLYPVLVPLGLSFLYPQERKSMTV